MATCYRHPNRQTGVACSNCSRPICPDCMTPTPVGMRCPECSREKTKVVRGPVRAGGLSTSSLSATAVLIAINVILFVGEMASGGQIGQAGGTLYEKLALWGPSIQFNHEYYRMVSYGFLHSGFLHIAFNMWFIWVLGNMLEPALGTVRFVALYFAAMLCGAFAVLLLEPNSVTVGASGAAFGLLGAAIVEARSRGIDIWASGLAPIAVINFLFTFLFPGISVGGHVGGFAGGLLVGAIYQQADRARLPRSAGTIGAVIVGAAAVVGGIVVVGS
jgi:membrane associated rhomboid family serine protease